MWEASNRRGACEGAGANVGVGVACCALPVGEYTPSDATSTAETTRTVVIRRNRFRMALLPFTVSQCGATAWVRAHSPQTAWLAFIPCTTRPGASKGSGAIV